MGNSERFGSRMTKIDTQAARSLVGEPARGLRADADRLLADIHALVESPTALRRRAKAEVTQLLNQQAMARLATTPVNSLKGNVPRGTRLGVVQNSRLNSLAAVVAASPAALAQLSGVGVTSAQEIYAAATKAADAVRAGEVVRFDISRRPTEQTVLLSTLTAIRRADRIVPTLREPAEQLGGQLQPLLVVSARTTSKLKMFFTGGATKRAALTALGALAGTLQN